MTTIQYMRTLSLAAARIEFSKIIAEVQETSERVDITKNGERAAVILSAEDYDSLLETIDVLSDPSLMEDLKRSRAEAEAGDVYSLEDVKAELKKLGRLR